LNLNAILPADNPNDFGKSRIATIGDGLKGSIQRIKKRQQIAINNRVLSQIFCIKFWLNEGFTLVGFYAFACFGCVVNSLLLLIYSM
jgi:hypothetical protein